MKTYIAIPASGLPSVLEVSGQELATLQDAVGDLIAPVDLPDRHTLYVGDNSLLDGKPFNVLASQIANYPLFGDAVMVGPVDRRGETVSVDQRWVALLTSLQRECL